jgi:hypothetical protein
MTQICQSCNRLLNEGDVVKVLVTSRYHVLKSTVAYALDKHELEADTSTLRHANCNYPQAFFEANP